MNNVILMTFRWICGVIFENFLKNFGKTVKKLLGIKKKILDVKKVMIFGDFLIIFRITCEKYCINFEEVFGIN